MSKKANFIFHLLKSLKVHERVSNTLLLTQRMTQPQIDDTLARVARYVDANPLCDMESVYAGAFGLELPSGNVPSDYSLGF